METCFKNFIFFFFDIKFVAKLYKYFMLEKIGEKVGFFVIIKIIKIFIKQA